MLAEIIPMTAPSHMVHIRWLYILIALLMLNKKDSFLAKKI